MDAVKTILHIMLVMMLLSTLVWAEEQSELDPSASAQDGIDLISDTDLDDDLLDGELTAAGRRALEEARLRVDIKEAIGSTVSVDTDNESDAPVDEALADLAARGLDEEVQSLKEEVLILNRELFTLEEELLFPSNTQFAVYVSVDVGEFFDMESVRVLMDNKPVASYLYTKRESDALMRGGVHRIYMGNLTAGSHELVAYYTGRGPRGREFKRATKRSVNKEIGPKYVELKISDNTGKKQSGFEVKEW